MVGVLGALELSEIAWVFESEIGLDAQGLVFRFGGGYGGLLLVDDVSVFLEFLVFPVEDADYSLWVEKLLF